MQPRTHTARRFPVVSVPTKSRADVGKMAHSLVLGMSPAPTTRDTSESTPPNDKASLAESAAEKRQSSSPSPQRRLSALAARTHATSVSAPTEDESFAGLRNHLSATHTANLMGLSISPTRSPKESQSSSAPHARTNPVDAAAMELELASRRAKPRRDNVVTSETDVPTEVPHGRKTTSGSPRRDWAQPVRTPVASSRPDKRAQPRQQRSWNSEVSNSSDTSTSATFGVGNAASSRRSRDDLRESIRQVLPESEHISRQLDVAIEKSPSIQMLLRELGQDVQHGRDKARPRAATRMLPESNDDVAGAALTRQSSSDRRRQWDKL